MASDVTTIRPPDDTGTDSLSRYVYQAHVAFPYCINCALGGDVLSVVPEHIEDIAIERRSGWQFIQVKTRDGGRGPWKLSDLTSKDGALRSLLRSHRAIRHDDVTLEIHLEGPGKNGDDIHALCSENGRSRDDIRSVIQTRLNISTEECASLLSRTRLRLGLPPRSSVIDKNLRMLGGQASALGFAELESIYRQVITAIVEAMSIDLADQSFWRTAFTPQATTPEEQERFGQKKIDRARLADITSGISSSPKPLLTLTTSRDASGMSNLEEKLIAGGATHDLIADAKSLRAQSSIKEFEDLSSNIWGDTSRVDDVRERLRQLARSKANVRSSKHRPANHIWDDLLTELSSNSAALDPNSVFAKDPFLLMGQVCELADMCLVHWGISDA